VRKVIRAVNISLRLSSNLTARHLLLLLINSFSEVLIHTSTILLNLVSIIVLILSVLIGILETTLTCVQTYV